jgi:hypothetical protein
MLGISPMLRHLPRDLSVGRDVEALAGIPDKYGALDISFIERLQG